MQAKISTGPFITVTEREPVQVCEWVTKQFLNKFSNVEYKTIIMKNR